MWDKILEIYENVFVKTGIEEKWYQILDKINEYFPIYNLIINPIEEKGIPSLLAFSTMLIVIILGICGFILLSSEKKYLVTIYLPNGEPYNGYIKALLPDGTEKTFEVKDGQVWVPEGAKIYVSDEKYKPISEFIFEDTEIHLEEKNYCAKIITDPLFAEVYYKEETWKKAEDKKICLPKKTVTIKVTAEGYKEKIQDIELADGVKVYKIKLEKEVEGKEVEFKTKCELNVVIRSDKSEFLLKIDGGDEITISNYYSAKVECGYHKVQVKYDGYEWKEKIVDTSKDSTVIFDYWVKDEKTKEITLKGKGEVILKDKKGNVLWKGKIDGTKKIKIKDVDKIKVEYKKGDKIYSKEVSGDEIDLDKIAKDVDEKTKEKKIKYKKSRICVNLEQKDIYTLEIYSDTLIEQKQINPYEVKTNCFNYNLVEGEYTVKVYYGGRIFTKKFKAGETVNFNIKPWFEVKIKNNGYNTILVNGKTICAPCEDKEYVYYANNGEEIEIKAIKANYYDFKQKVKVNKNIYIELPNPVPLDKTSKDSYIEIYDGTEKIPVSETIFLTEGKKYKVKYYIISDNQNCNVKIGEKTYNFDRGLYVVEDEIEGKDQTIEFEVCGNKIKYTIVSEGQRKKIGNCLFEIKVCNESNCHNYDNIPFIYSFDGSLKYKVKINYWCQNCASVDLNGTPIMSGAEIEITPTNKVYPLKINACGNEETVDLIFKHPGKTKAEIKGEIIKGWNKVKVICENCGGLITINYNDEITQCKSNECEFEALILEDTTIKVQGKYLEPVEIEISPEEKDLIKLEIQNDELQEDENNFAIKVEYPYGFEDKYEIKDLEIDCGDSIEIKNPTISENEIKFTGKRKEYYSEDKEIECALTGKLYTNDIEIQDVTYNFKIKLKKFLRKVNANPVVYKYLYNEEVKYLDSESAVPLTADCGDNCECSFSGFKCGSSMCNISEENIDRITNLKAVYECIYKDKYNFKSEIPVKIESKSCEEKWNKKGLVLVFDKIICGKKEFEIESKKVKIKNDVCRLDKFNIKCEDLSPYAKIKSVQLTFKQPDGHYDVPIKLDSGWDKEGIILDKAFQTGDKIVVKELVNVKVEFEPENGYQLINDSITISGEGLKLINYKKLLSDLYNKDINVNGWQLKPFKFGNPVFYVSKEKRYESGKIIIPYMKALYVDYLDYVVDRGTSSECDGISYDGKWLSVKYKENGKCYELKFRAEDSNSLLKDFDLKTIEENLPDNVEISLEGLIEKPEQYHLSYPYIGGMNVNSLCFNNNDCKSTIGYKLSTDHEEKYRTIESKSSIVNKVIVFENSNEVKNWIQQYMQHGNLNYGIGWFGNFVEISKDNTTICLYEIDNNYIAFKGNCVLNVKYDHIDLDDYVKGSNIENYELAIKLNNLTPKINIKGPKSEEEKEKTQIIEYNKARNIIIDFYNKTLSFDYDDKISGGNLSNLTLESSTTKITEGKTYYTYTLSITNKKEPFSIIYKDMYIKYYGKKPYKITFDPNIPATIVDVDDSWNCQIYAGKYDYSSHEYNVEKYSGKKIKITSEIDKIELECTMEDVKIKDTIYKDEIPIYHYSNTYVFDKPTLKVKIENYEIEFNLFKRYDGKYAYAAIPVQLEGRVIWVGPPINLNGKTYYPYVTSNYKDPNSRFYYASVCADNTCYILAEDDAKGWIETNNYDVIYKVSFDNECISIEKLADDYSLGNDAVLGIINPHGKVAACVNGYGRAEGGAIYCRLNGFNPIKIDDREWYICKSTSQ